MSALEERYPRTVEIARGDVELSLMSSADEAAILGFAQGLPMHDLLFLRRDITHPKVLAAWSAEIEGGSIVSLVAREAGSIIGCGGSRCRSRPTSASCGCWCHLRGEIAASGAC